MHFLVHFFAPHESNGHRPKLIHNKSLLFILAFISFFQIIFFVLKTTRPDILGASTNINVEKLLEETNKKRLEYGDSPLKLNDQLSLAAFRKAQDMFASNYWAHNSPDGKTPWVFIKNSNYQYSYAGENLAKDFSYSEDVLSAWMDSPKHRENVLSKNFDDVGFAVVEGKLNGKETTLVVQMFGRKNGTVELAKDQSQTISTNSSTLVYGVSKYSLFDSSLISRNVALITLGLLILTFSTDAIFIRKRKIVRLSGHNFDHILFLSTPLLLSLIHTGGSII